jgi:hypothetical protein
VDAYASSRFTPSFVGFIPTSAGVFFLVQMKKKLNENDFITAAKKLGTDVASIMAVAQVESRGEGFYSDGFPVLLFERHKFRQFTSGKYNASHPHLSGAAGNYGAAGAHQRKKFNEAFALNPVAAMKACSWGKFQICGFNHELCGFASVGEFVDAMKESEGAQLAAFSKFVISRGLSDALRNHQWARFAEGYNGAKYKENHYDEKLAAAYKKFANQSSISAAPFAAEMNLSAPDGDSQQTAETPESNPAINSGEELPSGASPDSRTPQKNGASPVNTGRETRLAQIRRQNKNMNKKPISDLTAMLFDVTDEELKAELKRRRQARKEREK